jgi:acid phosphatase type 7
MLSDLAKVDRARTPWLVVGGHRPFIIDSNNTMDPDGDQPVASALRDALEDIFIQYQVSMTTYVCYCMCLQSLQLGF